DPGCARPATPTGPRRSPTPSRRGSTRRSRPRSAWRSFASSAELVHELIECRAETLEAARDVEDLEQLLAERGVGHDGRRGPVASRSQLTISPAPATGCTAGLPAYVASKPGTSLTTASRRSRASTSITIAR